MLCEAGTPRRPRDGRARDASAVGRTVALLAAGLAAWTAAYVGDRAALRWLTFRVLGLAAESHLGQSVAFFLYDAPKVLLLLVLIVFGVGIVQSFFTAERTRALLAGRRESVGNVLAALLGVVTPFCSCSAVPLFLGLRRGRDPARRDAVLPDLGADGQRGRAGAALRPLRLEGRRALPRHRPHHRHRVGVRPRPHEARALRGALGVRVDEARTRAYESEHLGFTGRVEKGLESVRDVVGKVWPWVLAGIAVGAGIHGYVPEGLLAGFMGKSAWWSVPAAVVIGVPMYSNAAGIIPVVEALLGKGAALGTVLAFMMAVIGLSLPEIVILRKVLRPRLIAAFVGIVASGILMVGWLFNAVL